MADFTGSANYNTSTSTLEHLVAKTVDTVLNYSPSTLFFLGNQKTWRGTQMRFPVKWAKNSEGMSFDGLEKFSTTKADNFIYGYFSPTGREIPSVISQIEQDVNASNPTVNLEARQLASDAQDMASDISSLFWTLQSGKNFLSILDGVDDGTLGATTWGSLSRTTYSGLQGNYTNVAGNITLDTLRSAYNEAVHGPNAPNIIFTTKAVWAYYEKLLTPTVSTQISSTALAGYPMFTGASRAGLPNIVAPGTNLKGTQGFSAIYYSGIPVLADESVPTGYMAMLNTKDWGFYGLKSTAPGYKGVQFTSDSIDGVYNVPVTTGFSFSDYTMPVDQYGKVGHIILMGNLICSNPRNNSILIGITGA